MSLQGDRLTADDVVHYLHDCSRCSLCGEVFNAGEYITECLGIVRHSVAPDQSGQILTVLFHPECKELEEYH